MPDATGRIAILGAMDAEIQLLVSQMEGATQTTTAGCAQWAGTLFGHDCVVVQSGIGKAAAAASAQHVIDKWQPGLVIVCGLAGGVSAKLHRGDIVIGASYLQHDLDASPIFPRWQVPSLGITTFESNPAVIEAATSAAQRFVASQTGEASNDAPQVVSGLIITGDEFVTDAEERELRSQHPDAFAVDMEGAAVAYVCHVNATAFVAVRIISDNADHDAAESFSAFLEHAPAQLAGVLRELLPTV